MACELYLNKAVEEKQMEERGQHPLATCDVSWHPLLQNQLPHSLTFLPIPDPRPRRAREKRSTMMLPPQSLHLLLQPGTQRKHEK